MADRVIFVGPNSGSAAKLRTGAFRDRLFTFPTAYQAHAYLQATRVAEELIYVKASIADHLERLMLAELDAERQLRSTLFYGFVVSPVAGVSMFGGA